MTGLICTGFKTRTVQFSPGPFKPSNLSSVGFMGFKFLLQWKQSCMTMKNHALWVAWSVRQIILHFMLAASTTSSGSHGKTSRPNFWLSHFLHCGARTSTPSSGIWGCWDPSPSLHTACRQGPYRACSTLTSTPPLISPWQNPWHWEFRWSPSQSQQPPTSLFKPFWFQYIWRSCWHVLEWDCKTHSGMKQIQHPFPTHHIITTSLFKSGGKHLESAVISWLARALSFLQETMWKCTWCLLRTTRPILPDNSGHVQNPCQTRQLKSSRGL